MTFKCSRLDYLRVSDSRCWVNSIKGLKRMLRHNLFMSSGKNVLYLCGEGEHKGTSDNIAGEHLHILQLEEKEYSLSIITLPKLFLFVYVYVYAEYVLYTKLIYKYNILAQKTVFRHLTSNYF